MAVLSDFAKSLENVLMRMGPVFVRDTLTGGDFYALGVLSDPRVGLSTVKTSRDDTGREFALAGDYTLSFKMMQTSYGTELANISALTSRLVDIKFSDNKNVVLSGYVGNPDALICEPGVYVTGVRLSSSGELNFGGNESFIIMETTFRLSVSDVPGVVVGGLMYIAPGEFDSNPVLFAWQPSLDALTPLVGEGAGTFTRNSIATYTDANGVIQQVAANEARYQDGGILLEPQRTNAVPYSQAMTSGAWSNYLATVVASGYTTPDGGTNGFVATGTGASWNIVLGSVPVSASTVYTVSFWARKGATCTYAKYRTYNATGGTFIEGAAVSYLNQINSDTFTRVSYQVTTPAGCASIYVYLQVYATNGESIHLFGLQVEAGSYATSYIPTAGAAVTRQADAPTLPFTAGLPAEGMTVLMKGIALGGSTSDEMGVRLGTYNVTDVAEYNVRMLTSGVGHYYGPNNIAGVVFSGGPSFALGIEDDCVVQLDTANDTIRTFSAADAAQATAAIDADVSYSVIDGVIGRKSSSTPFVQIALLVVRGLLTPAQMRALLRS